MSGNLIFSENAVDPNFPITLLGAKLIAWWSPRDRATVWQNTAGSTAITADGQEIQRIDDKSGNGYHLTKNGGSAACIAGTGYGIAEKCATFWPIGGGSNFQVANSLAHATTNRNYFFNIQDRGLHNDPSWYFDVGGVPDFYLSPSYASGIPYMYANTVANGGGSRVFSNVRMPGYRHVNRFRFDATNVSHTNALFSHSLTNNWSTPASITMSNKFFQTTFADVFDIIVTDDTITSDEAAQLEEWLRARSEEPTAFDPATNLMLFGDSLTLGKGSQTYSSWPRMLFDSIGYEPRWAQIVGDGLKIQDVGSLALWIDGTRNNVCVYWLGTNDIYNWSRTAVQAQTDLETKVNAMLAAGADEVYVLTMIKRGAATGALETARQDYNTSIAARAGTVGYTVIDVAANAAFSNPANTTYYTDTIHLTDAGYAIVAGLVEAALGL